MPVFLGVDLGEKRVGISRSDETGTLAEPYQTLLFKSKGDLLKQLKACVESTQAETIVVGLPLTLKGEEGPAAQKVLKRVEWLKHELPLEWVLWDERLTTAEAERMLLEADVSREKRRQVRDQIAAQRILQCYLETLRHV